VIREIEHLIFTVERPSCSRFLKGRGIDLRNKDVELANTELFLCGGHGMAGLRINELAETTVPGLFAAGDVAPVPRAYLSGAFVYGEIAAESAVAFSAGRSAPKPDESHFTKYFTILTRLKGQTTNPVPAKDFEYKLRRVINEFLTPPKNEYKLERLLDYLDRLESDIFNEVRVGNQKELNQIIEVESILLSARLSAIASRERKESRWGYWHLRGDFPERNDKHWIKHVDLTMDNKSEQPKVSLREVIKNHEIGDIQ
jgi:succinate dehydrogenase/fumarate reductase flavoprotein subunit